MPRTPNTPVGEAPGRQGDAFQALVVRNSDFQQALSPGERAALRRAGLFVLDYSYQ